MEAEKSRLVSWSWTVVPEGDFWESSQGVTAGKDFSSWQRNGQKKKFLFLAFGWNCDVEVSFNHEKTGLTSDVSERLWESRTMKSRLWLWTWDNVLLLDFLPLDLLFKLFLVVYYRATLLSSLSLGTRAETSTVCMLTTVTQVARWLAVPSWGLLRPRLSVILRHWWSQGSGQGFSQLFPDRIHLNGATQRFPLCNHANDLAF